MPQAQPALPRAGAVGNVGLPAIPDVEKIAQHGHARALPALPEQICHGSPEVLPEQIEQRRLERGHRMDRRALIECLKTASAAVTLRKRMRNKAEQCSVAAYHLPHD